MKLCDICGFTLNGEFCTHPEELTRAVEAAKRFCEKSSPGAISAYGLSYLNRIASSRRFGSNAVKTQILYALSNLAAWRGPEAREAKKLLKAYSES